MTLVCGSISGDPPPGRDTVDGVEVVRYRTERTPRLDPFRVCRNVEAARRAVESALGRDEATTIHCHMVLGASAAFAAGGAAGRRRIYTIHSLASDEQAINWRDGSIAGGVKRAVGMPVLGRYEREVFRRADSIHVLSRFTAGRLASRYGSSFEGKVVRIPWWADARPPRTSESLAKARARLGWPLAPPTVFTLRRMVRRMGLSDFVEALARIPKGLPFRAVIAGDGPDRASLAALARNRGLEGRVVFPGRLSDEEVHLAYGAADVFVLPTRALEGFGIILLEALAAGCSVIASRAGAIPEIMEPVLGDWLFDAGDSEALSALLVAFLTGTRRFPAPEVLRRYATEGFGKRTLLPEYLSLLGIRSGSCSSGDETGEAGEE